MALEISSRVLDAIVAEADRIREREICGLLFGGPERITGSKTCRNVAADPATSFEIDPAALIAAHRAERAGGPKIAGCYHSHPSGAPAPSQRDADAATADGSIWIIVAGRELRCWRAVPLGGVAGRFDAVAFTTVREMGER